MADLYGQITLNEEPVIGSDSLLDGNSLAQLLFWSPRPGEGITVASPSGRLFRARLKSLKEKEAVLTVYEEAGSIEPGPAIALLQALPEKERMELIIQKTTELGVDSIIPFKSKKSITLDERESKQKKSHKWQEIALKAAKQSRRRSIPEVSPFAAFKEALDSVKDAPLKIVLWERPGLTALKDLLADYKGRPLKKAALLTGPEGGLTEGEVDEARRCGFIPVSLGKRILRTETASILTVGLLRYELGG